MGTELFARLRWFIQDSYKERFAECFSGFLIGLLHCRHLLTIHVPIWLGPILTEMWIGFKGLTYVALSTLTAAVVSYYFRKLIKPLLDGTKRKRQKRQGRNDKAA